MGVFKWLRRERVSIASQQTIRADEENAAQSPAENTESPKEVGTIRTEEYKRDLAEFRARRSSGNRKAFETPDNLPKKKSARHSLPISCTKCNSDVADVSFNYEKTSAQKYQQTKLRRNSEDRVPNIQFLFSNQQVFMPGNVFTRTSYSEVKHTKRSPSRLSVRSQDFTLTQHRIDFDEDGPESPPLFFKNNCLPFEVSDFLDASPTKDDSISELKNCKNEMPSDNRVPKVADEPDSPTQGGDDKLEEVMVELRNLEEWADEQLRMQSDSSKTESSKCDISYYGLPLVASSDVDIMEDSAKPWKRGRWGLIPVLVKKLAGVTLDQVRRRQCVEVNILRKFRHPNIMLLMGLYSGVDSAVHLICESCVSTLHNILHVQGSILSAQTSVSYASDIASALVFLHMQGYLHTELNSMGVLVTHCGVAKLADLGACVKYASGNPKCSPKWLYDNEAQYVNMEDGTYPSQESRPLLSAHPSDVIVSAPAAAKPYRDYSRSAAFRWQPPELFQPDDAGLVYPCSRSDVYALTLMLWECCNAAVPWQSLSYEKLSELYVMWRTGIRLPQDGTYPGCLLELLQRGLQLERDKRPDLHTLAERLLDVKSKLSEMEDILIPERLSQRKSEFSSVAWETNSLSDADSRSSPRKLVSHHTALVHRTTSEETSSQPDDEYRSSSKDTYELYKGTNEENAPSSDKDTEVYRATVANSCISEDDSEEHVNVVFGQLPEREFSSNCSTPVARKRTLREIGTPGANLHKSDSTEYCTLFSPEDRNIDLTNEPSDADRPSAKLCRSFTPKSYRSLEIKVPSVQNLEGLKSLKKHSHKSGTYKFDVSNYSLPSTPIARSNKLRKNAWLSGEVPSVSNEEVELRILEEGEIEEPLTAKSAPQITDLTDRESDAERLLDPTLEKDYPQNIESPRSLNYEVESYTDIKKAVLTESSLDAECRGRRRSRSWSLRSGDAPPQPHPHPYDPDVSNVSVRPLVAIHERWISEANTSRRSVSCYSPDGYRYVGPSVKPASHSVEPLQNSVPQLGRRNSRSNVTMSPTYSFRGRRGSQSEEFCKARDRIARSISFSSKDPDRLEHSVWGKDRPKCMSSLKNIGRTTPSIDGDEKENCQDIKVDKTSSLDDFVKQLIKREFYQLLNQTSDDNCDDDDLIQKGTNNVLNALKSDAKHSPIEPTSNGTDNSAESFSRVKISGNNKPLIQITFNKSGENSLQVLDSCVNVKICDSNSNTKGIKVPASDEQMNSKDDSLSNSLKRCQAFSALQEARSTEDLYIDDDLSTHLEENFGGNMKLFPLHGSLHEILCEKADDCCLIKVKQENGCDKMFFMCENPDCDSTDAIDGAQRDGAKVRDKVVFKRSISLIEERYERVFPKEKKQTSKHSSDKGKKEFIAESKNSEKRPKNRAATEVLYSRVKRDKAHSQSSPTLALNNEEMKTVKGNRRNSAEVVNIEHLMSYQDSSSDESLKDQHEVDDFEEMEKKIEADVASANTLTNICGLLEKISEENLSIGNDDNSEEAFSCNFDDQSESNRSSSSKMEFRKYKSCEDLP